MWVRVPTLLRGALVAIVILVLGQLPPGLFLIANLEVTPAVPWFLAATVAWLWCFWSAIMAFIPFFLAYSVLHGVLVFLTRSISPSVVLHALGDLSVHVLVVVLFGVAATAGLFRLAATTRGSRLEAA